MELRDGVHEEHNRTQRNAKEIMARHKWYSGPAAAAGMEGRRRQQKTFDIQGASKTQLSKEEPLNRTACISSPLGGFGLWNGTRRKGHRRKKREKKTGEHGLQ